MRCSAHLDHRFTIVLHLVLRRKTIALAQGRHCPWYSVGDLWPIQVQWHVATHQLLDSSYADHQQGLQASLCLELVAARSYIFSIPASMHHADTTFCNFSCHRAVNCYSCNNLARWKLEVFGAVGNQHPIIDVIRIPLGSTPGVPFSNRL